MLSEVRGKQHIRIQKKDRKKLILFLACALFSICLWLLFALAKTYTYTVQSTIELNNIPEKHMSSLAKLARVQLKIEGTGWQLLTSRINLANTNLQIDLSGHKIAGFLSLAEFIPDFNTQLPPGQRLLAIQPDTLRFNYTGRSIKKVPLVLRYSIDFQKQYYYLDPVQVGVDSVIISGPKAELSGIRVWESPEIKMSKLNHSVDTSVKLSSSRFPGLIVRPDHIKVGVNVDQFTESIMTVPVHLTGYMGQKLVSILPSHVKVFYLVPLTYFYNVRPELFEITADLDDWRLRHKNKLKLRVSRSPGFIRIEKIEPQNIDFLIHR